MKLVLTHDTALQLLRARREHGYESGVPANIRTLDDCACSLSEIEQFGLPLLVDNSKTIHVLVDSQASERHSSVHVCHVMSGGVPRGAFYQESDQMYVATPELLFVQQANVLSPVDLMLFGLELCGTYTRSASGDLKFQNCPEATTREKLHQFAERARKCHVRGAGIAQKSLRWVIDGSNSPMESALMLFLCLPIHRGGYGLPLPSLNPKRKLGKKAAQMLHQEAIRCDLHWLDKNVVVEYDSTQEHLNPAAAARDALRSDALGLENTSVVRITPQMITRPAEFDKIVRALARAIKKRMEPEAYDMTKARIELRKRLFPWLSRGGTARFL